MVNPEYMNWIVLVIAGFFEAGFAFCLGKMKGLSGIEYYFWGVGFLICLAISMVLLAKEVHTIPIGTAYPVWTGIGAVSTVVLGIIFFHEPISFARIFFVTTLIVSIVGLKTKWFKFLYKNGERIFENRHIAPTDRWHQGDTFSYRPTRIFCFCQILCRNIFGERKHRYFFSRRFFYIFVPI